MDPFKLHQSFTNCAKKNLSLIRLLKPKLSKQTQSIFQTYQKKKQDTQRSQELHKSYEELLRLNEEAFAQNARIQNQISVENRQIARLQTLKHMAELNLRTKKSKLIEAKQELKQRKQLEKKTQKIEQQNDYLQRILAQKHQTNKQLTVKRQDLRLCVNLLRNQKLLIQTQQQKVQAEYLHSAAERNRQIDVLERQLEDMKRQIMSMKYEMKKEEELAVKKNKTETLNDIRQMIKKHRDGLKD